MSENSNRKILAQAAAENFIGRENETKILCRHANMETDGRGLLILSAPSAGASELLRQTFDRIFNEQEKIPFYFSFGETGETSKNCAVRFLQTFLLQAVAARRNDANLLNVSPDICEIRDLAASPDVHWIHQLTKICDKESELNDERSFIRQALSAPLRAAAASDAPVVILLDNLQNAPTNLLEEFKEIYAYSAVPFVLAGQRRFLLSRIQSGETQLNNIKLLRLDNLSITDAEVLTGKLAKNYKVEISEQARDLIVRQFDSNPLFIQIILQAASEKKRSLESFQAIEQIYNDELFSGRIGRYYDNIFHKTASDFVEQKQLVEILREGLKEETGKISVETWIEKLSLNRKESYRSAQLLHNHEIINFNSGVIYFSGENEILKDYIEARYRLEILNESRALVIGNELKNSLKRAPQLMASFYRCSSVIGLRQLLSVFNCEKVPASFLDYGEFKKSGKEIRENAENETAAVNLPQIIYTANASAFYPPIARVADKERCVVGEGFATADYRQENEITWIAAEIDSKLEAARDLTEFWCDRLEMIALACDFQKYQLWLVAPEGFASDALEVLRERNAFGSSRQQIELLIERLKAETITPKNSNAAEYEMILPMGDDAELIAANAVEEIARRHHFASKDITKIKTALVEAYINAAEHSLSPDRKIRQKITVETDKIMITVSNRGIKLPPEKFAESAVPIEPDEGRRGWGLKLMRTLMDEVSLEQVDDGTRISMIKYLR